MSGMAGNCTGKVHHNSTGQTAEIYSSDGEMIASYNSHGGGWTIQQTQAESKFLQESAMIYKQAFDAARTEMNAVKTPTQSSADGGATVDFRAVVAAAGSPREEQNADGLEKGRVKGLHVARLQCFWNSGFPDFVQAGGLSPGPVAPGYGEVLPEPGGCPALLRAGAMRKIHAPPVPQWLWSGGAGP